MATNQTIKNQIQNRQEQKPQVNNSLKGLLANDSIASRFKEMLKDRAAQFTTSLLTMYNSDTNLQKTDPMTIVASAMQAAALNLPVEKNLGYAYIVPYGSRANFILGYKGYIQLALRSGQYKFLNVIDVHEGELTSWNPLTEELEINFEAKKSDAVIGYAGYFELLNGFKKSVYWTKDQIEKHKKKFSKSDFGWKSDYDAMARKTVIRSMLGHWGILSIEMQQAYVADVSADCNEVPLDTTANNEVPIDLTPEAVDAEFHETNNQELPEVLQ